MLCKELFYVNIPCLCQNDRSKRTTMKAPMILPHLMVEYLINSQKVVIDDTEIEDYWGHMLWRGVPWAVQHPAAGWKRKPCPLGIYGDEGQINKAGDKVVVCTMNFVLDARHDGSLHRFPMWCLREWCSLGLESIHPLTQVMAWSFNVLHLNYSFCATSMQGIRLHTPMLL